MRLLITVLCFVVLTGCANVDHAQHISDADIPKGRPVAHASYPNQVDPSVGWVNGAD